MGFKTNYKILKSYVERKGWNCQGPKNISRSYNKFTLNTGTRDVRLSHHEFMLQCSIAFNLHKRKISFLSNLEFERRNYFEELEDSETVEILRLDNLQALQMKENKLFDTQQYLITDDIIESSKIIEEHSETIICGKKQRMEPKEVSW